MGRYLFLAHIASLLAAARKPTVSIATISDWSNGWALSEP